MKRKDSFTLLAVICAALCLLAGLYLGWSRNLPPPPPPAFTPPTSPDIEHFGSSTGTSVPPGQVFEPGSRHGATSSTAPAVPTGGTGTGTGTSPNFGTGLTGSGPVVMPGLNTGLNTPVQPAPPPPPPPTAAATVPNSAPASPPTPPAPQAPQPQTNPAAPRPH